MNNDEVKSIQHKQVGASTYHANEALSLLDYAAEAGADTDVGAGAVASAQVHATLSVAAALRAQVVL